MTGTQFITEPKRELGATGDIPLATAYSTRFGQALGAAKQWEEPGHFFRVQRPKDMTQETGNACVPGKSSCVEADKSVS